MSLEDQASVIHNSERSMDRYFLSDVLSTLDILEDMRNRDHRLRFAYEAYRSFCCEDIGFLRTVARSDPSSILPRLVMRTFLGLTEAEASSTADDDMYSGASLQALDLIVNSAIYDILDVFGTTIDPSQVPNKWNLSGHIALLHAVWVASKGQSPKAIEVATRKLQQGDSTHRFDYKIGLAPPTQNIRVIRISPGTRESSIRCKLEKLDLNDSSAYDALSYVWGKDNKEKLICVDDQPFFITPHLHEILTNLRSPTIDKVIWIDAICINQTDNDERTHQVGLMRRIYSQAKSTIIWLGGQTADEELKSFQESSLFENPHNVLWPLPTELVGSTLDQYDLLAILEAARTQNIGIDNWSEMKYVTYLILVHCVNAILSCEWWERMWTIQEAVLPTTAPTIRFRGNSFSFDDLDAAMDFVTSRWSHEESQYCRQLDTTQAGMAGFLGRAIIHQMLLFNKLNRPFASQLRGTLKRRAGRLDAGLFFALLHQTGRHRSSDPRDKIFALESLVSRYRGRPFIHTDYNDTHEQVFGRVTAMYYNQSPDLYITSQYGLYVESQMAKTKAPACPSWVLDFTYSDAELYRSGESATVTFDGAVMANAFWSSENRAGSFDHIRSHRPCFATPKTLFCSGFCIGVICKTGEIPHPTPTNDDENIASSLVDITGSLPRSGFFTQLLWNRDILDRIADFFALDLGMENSMAFRTLESNIYSQRRKEIGGKFYFVTDTGLLGIAASPPQIGDIIALITISPVYCVLREVRKDDNQTQAEQHQMVARALVHAKPDETKAFLDQDSVNHRSFQIV
ncbi:heterokaryon incompatibility protein-domain-containing protein [Xylaria grammica]|nr:heterokaryon incompatibility protein-domain-containing protein [Xylaria grammica]